MINYQTLIIKEWERKGYMVVNLIKTSTNGICDLMCLKDGEAIFIECKQGNDFVKPLQKYRIDQLRKNGFKAFAIHETKGIIY
jgi:Holliday junction resolvase